MPEFQGLGPLFKSSPEPVALTESETEYVIRCTKHTFTEHMVFQVSRGPPGDPGAPTEHMVFQASRGPPGGPGAPSLVAGAQLNASPASLCSVLSP